ncbi:MAG: S8 family serine peptidase [Elusimicrobiota bacterium]
MGDSVWRMGAHELWRQGLTGKGVKVGVIDSGVGYHPDLEGVMGGLDETGLPRNYTTQTGPGEMGQHGTHVAGTIHALAPEAEIHSYKAIDEGSFHENRMMSAQEETTVAKSIMAAVDQAVKDGCHVINMSLGTRGLPSGDMAQKIEEHARNGVIFVISAGNEGGGGIGTPSNAPSAITVGSLDAHNGVSTFSSRGANWDVAKCALAVKTVFMAPGENISSTKLLFKPEAKYARPSDGYMNLSGTSMAAPHVAGSSALLVQHAQLVQHRLNIMNPVNMSRVIQDALVESSERMPVQILPGVPAEQPFLIVDPVAAREKLEERLNAEKLRQEAELQRPAI